jgi:diguanylate cyclase (GGDEF)-like protein/PAS domain S-box-containing protein
LPIAARNSQTVIDADRLDLGGRRAEGAGLHRALARVFAFRLSLQARVMLMAGLVVALVLLADAVTRQIGIERAGLRALAERAALLTSIQADALSVPMWNLDEDQVRGALDALAADPDFVSASIVRPDGSVLAQRLAQTTEPGGGSIGASRDIRYVRQGKTRTLGTLHLALATARLQATLAREWRDRSIALVLLLAAVLVPIYGALRQFTRPLEMMAGALTRLAAGDRETPIPASDQDDEVGAVARALQVFRDTAFRLVRAEGTYRALVENAALGIYGADEHGRVHSVNAALLRILGETEPAARLAEGPDGRFLDDVYADPQRREDLWRQMREHDGFVGEVSEIRRLDGGTAFISQTARALRDEAGSLLGYAGTVEDVTDQVRRQGEERLRVRAAMESASDAILVVDEAGAPLFANPAFERYFGVGACGPGADPSAAQSLPARLTDPSAAAALERALRDGVAWQGEADMLASDPDAGEGNAPDGRPAEARIIPMLIRASAIRDGQGASFGAVVLCTDLSHRRQAEARIQHMAHHDWLTGLPNRVLFRERLHEALCGAAAREREPAAFALLCIDLDRFKAVNDTLGHAAGDALLQRVGERLRAVVRAGDTVARVGGDEFTLIQCGLHRPEEAVGLAERLVHDLSQPYDLGGREVQIGASVGIALAPLHGRDPDRLLGFGDAALYDAKSQGRCRVSLFTPDMDQMLRERAELERDLRQAVAEQRLNVHYQPQFELATGRLVGGEALVRWTDPARGAVSPAAFIPVAEESGLINHIGKFVLATACRDAAAWPSTVRVAVNVSPAQFRAGDLIATLQEVLADTGLPPQRLELEITEGVFMQDSDLTRTALIGLKALGVRITLDDFGTGYASLSYLRRMPFDKIKVDRSFVAVLGHDPAANALVRSIIGLASGLGLETNAEGVETAAQAQFLREEGCQEVQGFHFGRPMPAADFATLEPTPAV